MALYSRAPEVGRSPPPLLQLPDKCEDPGPSSVMRNTRG